MIEFHVTPNKCPIDTDTSRHDPAHHSESRNREAVQERMETLECYCKSFDIEQDLTKKILQTLKYKWSIYNSLNEQVRSQQNERRAF